MAKVNQKFLDAAMKGLAKRPKLIKLISKGTEFHKLKEAGGVSGGFIRKLMKAGIVSKDDGIVTFEKGMEKAVGKVDVDSPSPRQGKEKTEKASKKSRKETEEDDEDEDEKPKKKGKKSQEDDEQPVKKGKKKDPEILKKAVVKLLRPVHDIPANKKLDAEYDGAFWWVEGKRIANNNLDIIKEKKV